MSLGDGPPSRPAPAPAPDPSPGQVVPGRRVQSVLFACNFNAVRSPMAEALARYDFGRSLYIRSAGVRAGEGDPFVESVLTELGLTLGRHRPHSFADLEEDEGLAFDLCVTLSPEAHHRALELTRTSATEVEYWPTPDPTAEDGSRERRLEAYRSVRDGLAARIRARLRG